jgi:hypothetical protein
MTLPASAGDPAQAGLFGDRTMNLLNRLQLARVWRAEYRRVHGELSTYSPRELASDLRLGTSDVDGVAREAADMQVAAYVRAHPEYRGAAGFIDRHQAMGGAY